jgi:hypothetical protein
VIPETRGQPWVPPPERRRSIKGDTHIRPAPGGFNPRWGWLQYAITAALAVLISPAGLGLAIVLTLNARQRGNWRAARVFTMIAVLAGLILLAEILLLYPARALS